MLTLYTWKTPNGYKIPILFEELGLDYAIHPVNIQKGEQRAPEFVAISPNGKIPALVDDAESGGSLALFESGAILIYLAEKHNAFLPTDTRGKYAAIEWLMFQMGGVGPMFGQLNHFAKFAPEKIEYGIKRYDDEVKRLCGVMDTRLADAEYLARDYSIADISTWPWVRALVNNGLLSLDPYKNLARWHAAIESRPAVVRALQKVDEAVAAHQA